MSHQSQGLRMERNYEDYKKESSKRDPSFSTKKGANSIGRHKSNLPRRGDGGEKSLQTEKKFETGGGGATWAIDQGGETWKESSCGTAGGIQDGKKAEEGSSKEGERKGRKMGKNGSREAAKTGTPREKGPGGDDIQKKKNTKYKKKGP